MIGSLAYEYIIATQPDESEFPALDDQIMCLIEMSLRRWWIGMTDANAVLVRLDDAEGLVPTGHADLFEFDGNRTNFDDWMSERHPNIGYCWIDQWVVAFSDRAAQLSFDHDLGQRVLRSIHLARTA